MSERIYKCCTVTERIDSGWLVEVHTHCTIGCEPVYGHQPGCGLVPIVQLDTLPGWQAAQPGAEQPIKVQITTTLDQPPYVRIEYQDRPLVQGWLHPERPRTVTPEQVDAVHEKVQVVHGKSGRARDHALLAEFGITVAEAGEVR